MINTYIDAEWYINQRIFLIGYGYENTVTGKITCKQLYKKNISQQEIIDILAPTTGKIFIYGPDVGMLEKVFNLDVRGCFFCVNLIKVVKDCYPNRHSYKLAEMEKFFGYKRTAAKYKGNIFSIYDDWDNPKQRKIVLRYNLEDVYFLIKVKQQLFSRFDIKNSYLKSIRLT